MKFGWSVITNTKRKIRNLFNLLNVLEDTDGLAPIRLVEAKPDATRQVVL